MDVIENVEELILKLNKPILIPQEGEIYHYEDEVDDNVFDFKILKEHKDFWEVEILEKEKIEKLPKDFGTIEMFNAGIITIKKGAKNV
jgi:hypothetical protein